MAADLATIRQAISDAADEISGLRCFPYPPDQVQPPVFYLENPETVSWQTAFKRGHDQWTLIGRLLVSTSNNLAAQKNRDAYFSKGAAADIRDAIHASTDLRDGTAAQGVFVAGARNFGDLIYNDVVYLGADFVIEVTA